MSTETDALTSAESDGNIPRANTKTNSRGKPAKKRIKKNRNFTPGGKFQKFADLQGSSKKNSRWLLVWQWTARRDLKLLELRVALCVLAIAKFTEPTKISSHTIALEIDEPSNHVARALKNLVAKKLFVRGADQQPYEYTISPYASIVWKKRAR